MLDEPLAAPIPVPLTSFVGRDHEVGEVCALLRLDDVRLLTLTGPGGVGKTRLALAAANAVAPAFRDGVRFIALAAVRDGRNVPLLLAKAVGVRKLDDRPFVEQVRVKAAGTNALLVVDNFEQLLPAAPAIVELLTACPGVTVLATSRERLRVSGEWDVPVLPLACPDPERLPSIEQVAEASAVRLFVERARAANPAFALAEANAAAVAAICHRLDGLPLALELAAARGPHLPPAALLARLARRLPLLTGGPRDVPARLQTMRDAIGWSYDLLTDAERVVFRRLAVFVGGCTLEAAEVVIGEVSGSELDPFEIISALVDASLLRQDSNRGCEPRYFMLETVREFGQDELQRQSEADDVRARHAVWALSLAEEAATYLRGPDQAAWLDRLDLELANLRAALTWLHEAHLAEQGLRLVTALWDFWVVRDRVPEGRRWMNLFLTGVSPGSPDRLCALIAMGDLAERQGDYAEATRLAEEALVLARECDVPRAEMDALRVLGNITVARAEVALMSLRDESLAFAEHMRAVDLLERSLALATELGDEWAAAKSLNWLANARWRDYDAALIDAEEATRRFRRIGDYRQLCNVLWIVGWLAHFKSDVARSRAAYHESLALAGRLGYRWHSGLCLAGLAFVAAANGEGEQAAWLLGASARLRDLTGEPLRPTVQSAFDRATATAKELLGEARFAAAFARGATTATDAAIAEVLSVAGGAEDSKLRRDSSLTREGLTQREIDVLRLVVEGRSDRAIADALFISRRTASKHVAAILAKLGATTRTEAAARAVREGLA